MTTAERMHFICPVCGLVLNLPSDTKRIICRCKFDSAESSLQELIADKTHYTWQRLCVCESCGQYMGGERCKLVKMGCRNEFRVLLHGKASECPSGLWDV